MTTIALVLGWVACGVLAAGGFVRDAQYMVDRPEFCQKYYRQDLGIALFLGFTGPLALVVSLFSTGFWEHGWGFSPRFPKQ